MKTIERVSIVDQVINNLIAYMDDNNCKPGDKMPTEKEVCESLGVGRSTVREAYRMMQVMNLVKSVQGRGVFVVDRNAVEDVQENWFKKYGRNISDYMEVREAIEPMAVRLAIQRAKPSDIRKLEKIHSKFKESVELDDAIKMASYDEAFHGYIAEITDNQLLIKIQENISEYFLEYRIRSFSVPESKTHALKPHQDIVDAFYEKDADKGEKVMIEHLKISFDDFQKNSGQDE